MVVLMAMLGQLLVQGDVLLLRSLVPEINIVEAAGKFAYIIGGVKHAVALVVSFHDIVIGTLAVEQYDQIPLFRRKTVKRVGTALMRHHHGPAVFDVLGVNGARIELGIAGASLFRRKLGQRGIECFGEVHGVLGTRIEAVMPGRKPDRLISNAMTSTVPLAGSTTGLM